LAQDLGFTATGVEPVTVDGSPVSSTRIREGIGAGDLEGAKRLLGRDYSVFGPVVPGERLGRKLGFPTANVEAANEQLPPDGVYAVRVHKGTECLPGVANLGRRPTVTAGSAVPAASRLEVHLLDRNEGEFYGEDLEVWFVRHLRPETRFPDLEALVHQIRHDVAEARALLGAC
jgi:riboflavin kinase/FMN adenylyltransferase